MRILLDEDSQGKVLVRLLLGAGHDVLTVYDAGISGRPDADILAFAKETGRVLLTRNARDFELLHQASPEHPGILVEYQDSDPSKNLTYPQIAAAIGKIQASGWDLTGQFVGINAWR